MVDLKRTDPLIEEIKKASYMFDLDMKEVIPILNLEPVPFDKYDIIELWNDVKFSVGVVDRIEEKYTYIEGVGKFRSDLELVSFGTEQEYYAVDELLKKYLKDCYRIYPIELTSRIYLWYSIYVSAYIFHTPPLYEPTEQEYAYFFMLKGKGRVEELEFLVGGSFCFHRFINLLYTKEAKKAREKILRKLLTDPETLEQIKSHTFVVPAKYQFILTTPQVYNAYLNTLNKSKKVSEKINPALKPVLERIIQLQKEGIPYELVEAKEEPLKDSPNPSPQKLNKPPLWL